MRMIDLTNQRYYNFIILERDFLTQKEKNSKEIFWKCQCDCGKIFSARGHDIRQNKIKSCGCLKKENTRNINYKDLTGQQFGKLQVLHEVPDKRIDKHCVWLCKCECGNTIEIMGKSLLAGHTKSCGCTKSFGEFLTSQALQELNINFITQKEFSDCKNILPLKFDFYLPDLNIIIECQGKQHYEPVQIFGGEERFKTQLKCDEIKKEWCRNNNIKLIEISYTDYGRINKEYIKKLIEE